MYFEKNQMQSITLVLKFLKTNVKNCENKKSYKHLLIYTEHS